MKLIKYFIWSLFLAIPLLTTAQIKFETTVSKNKLGLNQRLRVEFTINQQGADNFKAPSFVNFKVVGGPSSQVNQSWINGKASYQQSYIYFLEPKSIGEFTIAPAKIEYKGKVVASNAVKITVTKEVEIPKDPDNPYYVAQQNIHLVAEVSNTRPFVGQGIYVVYKLFVSDNIGVHDWRVSESPQYNGFWNQDIEVKEINAKRGKYNGEEYRYIILKRAILIPQRGGKLIIEPMKMDFSVGIPTGKGDFFGNMITKNINFTTKSSIKNVQVKDLPIEGRPVDFSGAVGDFEFLVKANKNTLKTNDAAQIEVTVKGKGNLKLFDIPKITTPPELEVFTPEHKENVVTSLSGLRGSISDYYTVVPEYGGKYKIPEVSFSYFDPKAKDYKTITSDAIFVDVMEGKDVTTGTTDSESVNKKNVVASDNNFRFIALHTVLKPAEERIFLNSRNFYLLLLLPLIAIPVGVFVGKKKAERAGDILGNKIRKADKLAKKYLSKARKQLGKKEEFYIALEKALHNFLKAKLQLETTEISQEHIAEILQKRKVDKSTVDEFIEVLNDCDFARYTPTTDVMMKKEYEKAKVVITKLDRQL